MAGWSYMTLSHDHNISAHVHNCLVCDLPSDEVDVGLDFS